MTLPAVPWARVVVLGTVLALGDWFWIISLRGATGAVERVQEPFAAWLRGGLLLVPLFVLAVMGALALGRRRWGPDLRGARAVAATCVLVALAATVAALGVQVVSAAYDYRLQLAQLGAMTHGDPGCADCLGVREEATLVLQLKTLGASAAILLTTNLVLAGWVTALLGGRLEARRVRPQPSDEPGARAVGLLVTAALVGAGTVHAALSAAELSASPRAGTLQLVLALAAMACARSTHLHPRPLSWGVAVLLAGVPLAWWSLTHTAVDLGLATGAIGVLDLGILGAAVVLLRGPAWLSRSRSTGQASSLALVAVLATTAIGLGGSGLSALDLTGVSDHATVGQHRVVH